jgi:hypothetical protein
MSDTGRAHVKRHDHSSPFWGIMLLFAVVVIGLVTYGYHGMQTLQTAGTTISAVPTHGEGDRNSPSKPANQS